MRASPGITSPCVWKSLPRTPDCHFVLDREGPPSDEGILNVNPSPEPFCQVDDFSGIVVGPLPN